MKNQRSIPLNSLKAAPIIQRIQSLDIIRGFALLGILIMNIQGFSMISAAYLNPTTFGDLTGLNKMVWILSHLFADQKFMALFSLLFGAGIVLMAENMIKKNKKPAKYHYKRMLILLFIGLIHAYLLWYGDILVPYSIAGSLAFLFRKTKPKRLFIAGIALILIGALISLFFGISYPFLPAQAQTSISNSWSPPDTYIEWEQGIYQSGWIKQMKHRVSASLYFETFIFLINIGWKVLGMMLIGMAFLKWKIITGQKSKKFYKKLLFYCGTIGLIIIGIGIYLNFNHQWSVDFSFFYGAIFNYIGSLFVCFAYIGLMMLICLSDNFTKLKNSLAKVGKMAFTNYLLMTVLCTLIFYGHGLRLFGIVNRSGQIFMVFIIWLLIIGSSNFWLSKFKYGPVEWLYRSLTYSKRQPFKR